MATAPGEAGDSPPAGSLEKADPGVLELGSDSQEDEELRKVADRIPGSAWLVMLLTMAERFSFYGMTAPLMNFMQHSRDSPLRPGALGWGQARASQVSNVFYILTLLTPIAAALVADKRLGRYNALCVTFVIYVVGAALLLVSSLPSMAPHAAGLFIA